MSSDIVPLPDPPTLTAGAPVLTPGPVRQPRGDTSTFVSAVLGAPLQVGAIWPSSRRLARLAAAAVPSRHGVTVAELGPGTGVVSDAIHHRLDGLRARHLAVELNPTLVGHLQRSNRPWLDVIAGDAADLVSLLAARDVDQVDAVVSALPWTLLPGDVQDQILRQIRQLLAVDGTLSVITTLTALPWPSARAMRARLAAGFGQVTRSRLVWRNLPPALVYTCRRPLPT
ncbi:class I SAM-dependent methyltransferase [Nonomuraea sp. NPDC050536]|uniref:class I SAM-dependent methyltransferase n=1 Tax=Nonomuraea sp. NPDC050536 TaxID=3364366 RepID=UPI0037C93557